MIKSIIGSFTGTIVPVLEWGTKKSFAPYLIKSSNPAYDVSFINDKFMVVGKDGRSNFSTDGINWDYKTLNFSVISLIYNNNTFIGVGYYLNVCIASI